MKLRFVFALIIAKVCSKILERDVVDRLKKLQEEKNISLDDMTALFDKIGSERTKDFPMVCSFSYPVKCEKFDCEFYSKNTEKLKKIIVSLCLRWYVALGWLSDSCFL